MIKYLIIYLLLVFPSILYAEKSIDNSDEKKIKKLIHDFYSSSGDKELNHRYELLCSWDKKTLVKNRIINIWAHQLHSIELKNIIKISIKDKEAEVLIEIDFKPNFGEENEIKILPVYVKKESDHWKIAYLYFQPPLFTTYP